jgi:glycosyltransferase involved in cell wall biosynthesis
VTLRYSTERPETLDVGSNVLAGTEPSEIVSDHKLKIIIVSLFFPPDFGGGATRVLNLCKGLLKGGHSVVVIRPKTTAAFPLDALLGSDAGISRFHVIDVSLPFKRIKGFLGRLLTFVIFSFSASLALSVVNEDDIVYGCNPNIFVAIPLFFYKVFKKCKVALDVPDLWPDALVYLNPKFRCSLIMRIGYILSEWAYRSADVITVVSNRFKVVLEKRYPFLQGKVFFVPIGVDLKLFRPSNASRIEILKRSLQLQDSYIVLYHGNIGGYADVLGLVNEFSYLQDCKAKLVIIGSGEEEAYLRRLIEEKNLHNVVLLPPCPLPVLRDLISLSNIGVIPIKSGFIYESIALPTKFFEYLACGTPVICPPGGEMADLVSSFQLGYVCMLKDIGPLIQSLSNSNIQKDTSRLRRFIESNFSIDSVGELASNALSSVTHER